MLKRDKSASTTNLVFSKNRVLISAGSSGNADLLKEINNVLRHKIVCKVPECKPNYSGRMLDVQGAAVVKQPRSP